MEAESRVGTRPADTRGVRTHFADVQCSVAPDQPGRWPLGLACDRAAFVAGPARASAFAPNGTSSPKQTADRLFPPPPWSRVPPVYGLTTAITASPSKCGVAGCPPGKRKRFSHSRHADRDWNKIPVVPAHVLRRSQTGRCHKECCAGSKSRPARSAGKATA